MPPSPPPPSPAALFEPPPVEVVDVALPPDVFETPPALLLFPEDEVDEDTLGEFLSDFKKGKAKPFIKSKPVPKKQGNVIEVVGKTFNDIVMDESKVSSIFGKFAPS